MRRINQKIRRFWGISEVGFSVMSMMETSFLLYFLTDVAKYPLNIAAVITGFSAVADAACAVFAGIVIDKVSFRAGKYRPWLLCCPPMVMLSFVFCFTRIGNDVLAGGIVITAYIISHFFWTVAWTANRNLISVLTDDPGESSFLSARIAVGTSAGKVAGALLVPDLAAAIGAVLPEGAVYPVVAAVACCIFAAGYWLHFLITKGCDSGFAGNRRTVKRKEWFPGMTGNSNLIAVVLHDAVRLVSFYGIAASVTYYAKIVLEDPSAVTGMLLMFYTGTAAGACFSHRLSGRYGVKRTTALSCAGCALLHGLCYFFKHMILTDMLLFLAQFSFGIAFGLTTKLYHMCGIYGEWKTGKNAQGVVMSLSSLSVKVAIAVRGILITGVLGWVRYNPAEMVTVDARNGVRILFFVVFSAVMLISLLPLRFFRLDDASVFAMSSDIAARELAGKGGGV